MLDFYEEGIIELYNIKDDIGETNNLAKNQPTKRDDSGDSTLYDFVRSPEFVAQGLPLAAGPRKVVNAHLQM